MIASPILPENIKQSLQSLPFPLPGDFVKTDSQAVLPQALPVTSPVPTFIPTSIPPQGPGIYACDPYGICNVYSDPVGMECPRTFVDTHCLGRCSDKSIQCTK